MSGFPTPLFGSPARSIRLAFRPAARGWRSNGFTQAALLGVVFLSAGHQGFAQSGTGEIRLSVVDGTGHGVPASVELVSDANSVQEHTKTFSDGTLSLPHLAFGRYALTVNAKGFATATRTMDVEAQIPSALQLVLSVAGAGTNVQVHENSETLLDSHQAGSVIQLGAAALQKRAASLPGRSLIDLIDDQPGWLFEGNAVLHPRGSEYQVQYVLDGIPLTDNRSPGANVQVESNDVQQVSIYTAGFPAEYGRKMGGVIVLNTFTSPREGLHGVADVGGGSFNTTNAYLNAQYGWKERNQAGLTLDGAHTDWYENPPVIENYTNTGTSGDAAGQYQRQLGADDSLAFSVRHELARFLVPNELLQQQAGQRQDRDLLETIGTTGYQHIFSPSMVGDLHVMVRDDTTHLSSNPESTPIYASQDRGFRESYVKGGLSIVHARQEIRLGAEGDFTNIHEQFADQLTDPDQFDDGTPQQFSFFQRGRDREQGVFAQDTLHLGNWNIAAGLRWDHYSLIVDRRSWSPRLSVSKWFPHDRLMTHFSYDRIFQTPAVENILLSSSAAVTALNSQFLRLPVEPSSGNDYEAGLTKAVGNQLRFDANGFVRTARNYADDDQLLDTAVSFPISFRKAFIYGAEGSLRLPHWRKFSGFLSYSYLVGSAYLPVTGGLFLGDDAQTALSQRSGRFWISQDQRNTLRTRFRYQLMSRLWMAAGAAYGSGLPTEFDGDQDDAIAQYGKALTERVNFARNRVRPSLSVDASAGADLLSGEKGTLTVQIDAENLNDRLNLIDFAGLFSGNAVAPPRHWAARMRYSF